MKIGFHLPIAKGFNHTRKEATRLGCEVAQIFVKNPRSWAKKTWADRDLEAFRELSAQLPVFAHLSYLPNIARCDEEPRNKSGLLHEAELCTQLGIGHLIVHCGSRENLEKGIDVTARCVEEVVTRFDLSVLLEGAAGQGSAVGKNLDELARIYERIDAPERTGFCLDTAHLFQAGYDVRRKSAWDDIMNDLDGRLGPGSIKFFHLNDSKTPLGSAVDRHWHIGQGEIGLECFRFLVNEKRLAHLGGVMETPKMGKMDEENMKTMRSLLSPLVSGSFS